MRVFISSTFADMQAERDHLVRFVLPRLREDLQPRRIHLVGVDLRWGVTSEQDVSDICREVIDDCRPRFLCLLGGRYGTVPLGEERSITADEIHYGVLDRTIADRGFAYFYFREEAATAAMVETTPGQFREPRGSENERRLTELKCAIRAAGLNPVTYSARWDDGSRRLTELKTLGEHVYSDLLGRMVTDPRLRDRFEGVLPSAGEFAEEQAAIDAFVERCTERFVLGSRDRVQEELLGHIRGTGGNGYYCLVGPPGSGKSAMLAHISTHPTLIDDSLTVVIRHFAGTSPDSTNVRRTLRHLCHAIKNACRGVTGEVPDEPEQLRLMLRDCLRQASATQHVVILLDGVNQLDARPPFSSFHWLPAELPPNVRVILSTSPGAVLDDLRRTLAPLVIELDPLTRGDAETIVTRFCQRYRKNLEPEQRTALLAKTDAGTPLYVLVALEELRTLGTPEETTRCVAELPPTTDALFAWILRRLADDDGFRNSAGHPVGPALVSRFAALLGASRYGLSQRELVELVDPGDPEGNVAALLNLVRPYLMYRGELFDFYHGQFRDAAVRSCLRTDSQRQAAHSQLANYFRDTAAPERANRWSHDARPLGELPFHLAGAARIEEIRKLFSQLAFLAARVASGQIFEQLADYALAGVPSAAGLTAWHAFLQKHAQRLSAHPAMLVALVNHEGFDDARSQLARTAWPLPWLRTSTETMPPAATRPVEGLRAELSSTIEFSWHKVSALAPQRAVAFGLEQLGTLRVFDLNDMRPTDVLLSIKRDRPLVLACAPDARSLAVFYETGRAELYRCAWGTGHHPAALERVAAFDFYLPETQEPVVVWHDGAYWYQARSDALAHISLDLHEPTEDRLAAGQRGELCALVFVEGTRLVALRQGRDVVLVTPGAPPLRRESTDLAAACPCGPESVAAGFTDGELVVFHLDSSVTASATVRAGILRGGLGWDGMRLLWLSEDGAFISWRPGDAAPLPVEDNQEVFPVHLHVTPRRWILEPDGSLLLGTTHSIVALRVLQGGAKPDGRLEQLLGGPTWRAVLKRDRDQWLLERQYPEERLLGREVMGRLYCANDGEGRLFAPSGYGPGYVVDLTTFQGTPLQDCPMGINAAVGDIAGGCWLTDRTGDIYFADQQGCCDRVVELGLSDVHGANLVDCGDHLLWLGHSVKYFPDTGAEPARTFVFFRKARRGSPTLERVGEHFRHPREGQCFAALYDVTTGRLVTLWVTASERGETTNLRVAPVTAFARWEFAEIPLTSLGPYTMVQADLSADGRFIGVLNRHGEFVCVAVSDGRVVATLAGSAPFIAVAPGRSGPEFWISEPGARIRGCTLVEGAFS